MGDHADEFDHLDKFNHRQNHKERTLIAAHSPCFLIPANGLPEKLEVSDIEMISLQSATYTSLRDLIPASPPSVMSPTNNSSWHEIPIRNPLVKQAALAYLQPMSTPPEVGDKGILARIRERCGCLRWLRDAVVAAIWDAFWGPEAEEEDDDYDEDEEDDGKVD